MHEETEFFGFETAHVLEPSMKAATINKFGGPEVIQVADVGKPVLEEGEVLVRVKASGVGPWDAFVRGGMSAIPQPLPLVPGSDISGVVEAVGPGVIQFKSGDQVYGVTNEQFTGGYAEYAAAKANMLDYKPADLSDLEAASAPVIAVTAWQALFEYGNAVAGQTVLIHGAAGNVGAYAVQLAKQAGLRVIATASGADTDFVKSLGADQAIDYKTTLFDEVVSDVDIVVDTISGDVLERSTKVTKPGGIIVSIAAPVADDFEATHSVKAIFFLAEVTAARLHIITEQLASGKLKTHVGSVLHLSDAAKAHKMLAGAPHERGKILLTISS